MRLPGSELGPFAFRHALLTPDFDPWFEQGAGTFGTCYAVVMNDKRLCCAKLANASIPESADELWQEATILRFLNRAEASPGESHIVRLLQFDSSRGTPFILLELMDESLEGFLRRRRGCEFHGVSLPTLRSFAEQLLAGLKFLFDHGIGECTTSKAHARAWRLDLSPRYP